MNNPAADLQKSQPGDQQTQIVFLDEREDESLDRVSFDEMNIVELPFSLPTRDTSGIYEIPLSADGSSRVVCANSTKYGLPNSLAGKVALGLMAMWKKEYGDKQQSFAVKLRDLVVRYMFPDRSYAPNSELLQSVERQINCIANTRIHTDRWWDRKLRRQQTANIALISDVKVLDEGGPHRPRVLQVTWGQAFFESMVNNYTKPLDATLVQKLDNPLDLQLYRLLDRQLACKSSQPYNSIVELARFKLGMQNKKLERGGRTASSYAEKTLAGAVERLNRAGFKVWMTINRKVVPFSVTFERPVKSKPRQPDEVPEHDLVEELVREFLLHAHGVPREQGRTRTTEADRSAAKEWLDAYGFEKAKWMVQRAVKLQKERGGEKILVFKGLQRYEAAASGAYERQVAQEASRFKQQFSEELDRYWSTYCAKLVELFDLKASPEELASLEATVRENLQREVPDAPPKTVNVLLRFRLHDIKWDRMSALSKTEFRAHRSLRELRETLIERHGRDLLAPASAEGEEDLSAP